MLLVPETYVWIQASETIESCPGGFDQSDQDRVASLHSDKRIPDESCRTRMWPVAERATEMVLAVQMLPQGETGGFEGIEAARWVRSESNTSTSGRFIGPTSNVEQRP